MSDKRYFGGSTVEGKVRRLAATSFKELVERYFNVPVLKKFTRREYDSYDVDTKKAMKDGPFVTAAVFSGDDVRRRDENCIAVTLALLDFDSLSKKDVDEGFVDYAQQLFEAPDAVKDALYPYNFVCYETISSRKGDRRVRILVDLQEMGTEFHKPAVRHIASLLGVDVNRWKGRIESMTLVLPMFRPVEFLNEDYAAILCSRTDGVELDDLDIPKEAEVLDEEGNRVYAYTGGEEDLDMLFMPVVGITVEDMRPVLDHIDPDDSYHTWVMVGMGLRHQFRGREGESKDAYEVFDEWSGKGAKYVDRDETYLKWKSFKPDATGRAPVTIRSVFEKAKTGGWDPTSMSKKIKRDLAAWIAKCVDPDELMQRGAAKIAAMPFKNEIVEEALFLAIQKRIHELTDGTTISKVTIKKAVRSFRQKERMEDDDMPPWLRPWVYITTRNLFRHMGNGIELSPEAFNNTYSRDLMNMSPDSECALTGRPTILPVNFALNVKNTKRVDGTTYDPRFGGEEPFFEHNGRLFLNEYRASTIPRLNSELAEKAGKIFKHHLKLVVGEEHFKLMMDFFAHTVQFPGVLIRWAPLIQSAQGAGKNMIFNAVGFALGEVNAKTVNAKQVLSDYNEWMSGAQLIVLDEIKIPGHAKADLTNSLKDLITNDTITISQKFQDLRLCQNVANKAALTNWHDALFMEDTDRRWYPIKSPIQTKAECSRLADSGHFKRFAKLYKFGGALRQFLLDWQIDPAFPVDGPAPDTSFRQEMVNESRSALHEEIEDLIENPEAPLIGSEVIFTPALTARLVNTKNNYKPSHFLRRMGFDLYKQGEKFSIDGIRGTVWVHVEKYSSDLGRPEEILLERSRYDTEKDL